MPCIKEALLFADSSSMTACEMAYCDFFCKNALGAASSVTPKWNAGVKYGLGEWCHGETWSENVNHLPPRRGMPSTSGLPLSRGPVDRNSDSKLA